MSLGVTDIPVEWKNDNEDLLGIRQYLKGLEKFIVECPTPISIAIQGDWGSGKTSIINYLKKELGNEKYANIHCVYFNTWQYSQFNMANNLYFSLLSCMEKQIKKDTGRNLDIKNIVLKIAATAGAELINMSGLNSEKIEKCFIEPKDMAEVIPEFKEDFSKAIKNVVGDYGKMVIFIDDLDRLNPDVAVELLEIMKLFMDVKQCIFVLAVDYDVVVQGVRKKFGNDVSIKKCKSFFDKIIQVPFRMPVESYKLDKMIGVMLKDIIDKKYCDIIAEFTKKLIGENPRTIKRMINSFLLIKSVYEVEGNKMDENKRILLYCSLCMQMGSIITYSFLQNLDEDMKLVYEDNNHEYKGEIFNINFESISTQDLSDLIENTLKYTDDEVEEISDNLQNISHIFKYITQNSKNINIYNEFYEILQMSSVTTVDEKDNVKVKRRNQKINITKIKVGDEEILVNNATEAMKKSFKKCLLSNSNIIGKIVDNISVLTDDESRDNSSFRQKEPIEIKGKIIYLGTSLSFVDKVKHINKLCNIIGSENGFIQWFNNNEIIFQNEKSNN